MTGSYARNLERKRSVETKHIRESNAKCHTRKGDKMSQLEETQESLSRMQAFDPKSLAREEDLGRNFDFSAIVAPASKLIRLYNQLGLTTLDDFPAPILTQIKQQADADFNRFQQF